MTETVHVALYDTFVDWEVGHAIDHVQMHAFQRDPGRFEVRTVGLTADPVTSSGNLRILPDLTIDELRPEDSAMLILSGNDVWPTEAYRPWTDAARAFLDAGVPVAAICGATGGLAVAGLLDDRDHTSNAKEFLAGLDYGGLEHYRDQPVVDDGGLITAGAVDPVDFAYAILKRLGVYEPAVLESWYLLYGRKDPAGFYQLMSA